MGDLDCYTSVKLVRQMPLFQNFESESIGMLRAKRDKIMKMMDETSKVLEERESSRLRWYLKNLEEEYWKFYDATLKRSV